MLGQAGALYFTLVRPLPVVLNGRYHRYLYRGLGQVLGELHRQHRPDRIRGVERGRDLLRVLPGEGPSAAPSLCGVAAPAAASPLDGCGTPPVPGDSGV